MKMLTTLFFAFLLFSLCIGIDRDRCSTKLHHGPPANRSCFQSSRRLAEASDSCGPFLLYLHFVVAALYTPLYFAALAGLEDG